MKNDISGAMRDFIRAANEIATVWHIEARQWRELEAAVGRARLNTPYGPDDRERFDLFHPAGRAKGMIVLLHGAEWPDMGRETISHFAQGGVALGQAVAVPSWTIGGRTGLSAATGQIIASLERAASMVEGPITVVGHGAGAWLATRLADPGAPLAVAVRARIGAIAALSPVLDLRPLAEIADEGRSEARTTAPGERSPKGVEIPLGVWMASAAPAALQDNASALVASAPASVPHTFPAGHFDIMETLRDPGSAVLQRLLA